MAGIITIGIIKIALNIPLVLLIFVNRTAINNPKQSSIAREPKPYIEVFKEIFQKKHIHNLILNNFLDLQIRSQIMVFRIPICAYFPQLFEIMEETLK